MGVDLWCREGVKTVCIDHEKFSDIAGLLDQVLGQNAIACSESRAPGRPTHNVPSSLLQDPVPAHVYVDEEADGRFLRSCPNTNHLFPGNANYAHSIRSPLKNMVESVCPRPKNR